MFNLNIMDIEKSPNVRRSLLASQPTVLSRPNGFRPKNSLSPSSNGTIDFLTLFLHPDTNLQPEASVNPPAQSNPITQSAKIVSIPQRDPLKEVKPEQRSVADTLNKLSIVSKPKEPATILSAAPQEFFRVVKKVTGEIDAIKDKNSPKEGHKRHAEPVEGIGGKKSATSIFPANVGEIIEIPKHPLEAAITKCEGKAYNTALFDILRTLMTPPINELNITTEGELIEDEKSFVIVLGSKEVSKNVH